MKLRSVLISPSAMSDYPFICRWPFHSFWCSKSWHLGQFTSWWIPNLINWIAQQKVNFLWITSGIWSFSSSCGRCLSETGSSINNSPRFRFHLPHLKLIATRKQSLSHFEVLTHWNLHITRKSSRSAREISLEPLNDATHQSHYINFLWFKSARAGNSTARCFQ